MPTEPPNLNKPEVKVAHSELERWDSDSAYKSKCPACGEGILLIHRDPKTLTLQRQDRCISCGQQFFYTDPEVNGEKFKVPYPMFELVGHPCENPECKGVLTSTIHLKTQMFSKNCSICGREFCRMPMKDAMGWAIRTIKRALNGEKDN